MCLFLCACELFGHMISTFQHHWGGSNTGAVKRTCVTTWLAFWGHDLLKCTHMLGNLRTEMDWGCWEYDRQSITFLLTLLMTIVYCPMFAVLRQQRVCMGLYVFECFSHMLAGILAIWRGSCGGVTGPNSRPDLLDPFRFARLLDTTSIGILWYFWFFWFVYRGGPCIVDQLLF